MLYTSSSASLALLETLVHLPSYLVNKDYCLLTLEVPELFIMKMEEGDLPYEWNSFPFKYQTQQLGNQFIQEGKHLGLKIPSAVLALETNILLNPGHKNFSKIKIISQEKLQIDEKPNSSFALIF